MVTLLGAVPVRAQAVEICGIDGSEVPAACLPLQNSCPIFQTCVINQQLRNEDIPNVQLRDTVLMPLQAEPGSEDAGTVNATPGQPIIVANASNPLVSGACRRDVERGLVMDVARDRDLSSVRAQQFLRAHLEEMHSAWAARGWQSLQPAEVFAHVAECKEFCGPLVTQLAQCHIWAVSESPVKTLFTFEVRHHEWSHVLRQHPATLATIVDELHLHPAARAAVIGRASRDGDEQFNQRLSYLRAQSVRSRLLENGIDGDRISLIWLGEQPPRIGSGVAEAYGLTDLYRNLGSERQVLINRSVMAVVYHPEGLRQVHHLDATGAR